MTTGPTIRLLTLGGTIAMAQRSAGGVVVNMGASEILASLSDDVDTSSLSSLDVLAVDSSQLTMIDVLEVIEAVERARLDGILCVLITTGTDSMEELAFVLNRMITPNTIGVVITGAMRNPTMVSHDGPMNLRSALRVAMHDDVRTLGVVVVMNDEIHGADFVSKTHATSTSSFTSYPGALGWVTNGNVTLQSVPTPARANLAGVQTSSRAVRVPLLTTYLGDDATALRALSRDGIDGVVVEGFGSGRVTSASADAMIELATSVPVVLASRTGSGLVEDGTYGGAGSESRLLSHGVSSAGWLPGVKARLLLELLLRQGRSHAELTSVFEEFQR